MINALEAFDEAISGAHELRSFEFRSLDGTLIERVDLTLPGTSRVFILPRQHLHQTLLTSALRAGVELVTNSEAVAAYPRGELVLASGRTLKADLVAAADGVHSQIRRSLRLTKKHIHHGEGSIRLLIPRTVEEMATAEKAVEWWSGSRRILYTPCGQGTIYLCMTVRASDEDGRATPVRKSAWKASFPPLHHLIDRIGDEARWDVLQTVIVKRWSCGRVALLGDAAHAMTPGIAQGGGMAMSNALALATFLDEYGDTPKALEAWEDAERPLTDHTQRWSARLWPLIGWPPQLAHFVGKIPVISPWIGRQRMIPCMHVPRGTGALPVALTKEGSISTSPD